MQKIRFAINWTVRGVNERVAIETRKSDDAYPFHSHATRSAAAKAELNLQVLRTSLEERDSSFFLSKLSMLTTNRGFI